MTGTTTTSPIGDLWGGDEFQPLWARGFRYFNEHELYPLGGYRFPSWALWGRAEDEDEVPF